MKKSTFLLKLELVFLRKINTIKVGGRTSGDVNCIMRYNAPVFFESEGDRYRTCAGPYVDDWAAIDDTTMGTRLCISKAGTGLNANGALHGDATKGNCRSQINIKSWDNTNR